LSLVLINLVSGWWSLKKKNSCADTTKHCNSSVSYNSSFFPAYFICCKIFT